MLIVFGFCREKDADAKWTAWSAPESELT